MKKLAAFFALRFVDEERNFPLTMYTSTKGEKKIIESDHNILYAKFSIEFKNKPWKQDRQEVFNDSFKLRRCFNVSK